MSEKSVDKYNRFRSITIGFRVSPEESDRINMLCETSGMSKQDYIVNRLENREINVHPNIRVMSYLGKHLDRLAEKLERVNAVEMPEVIEDIEYLLNMIKEMR